MRLFGKRTHKPFLEIDRFEQILANQSAGTPATLGVLRENGVDENAKLRIEYFFYSNSADKAAALADSLRSMGYTSEAGPSAHDKKVYLINGWTRPLAMKETELLSWTETMCRLGLSYDCEFDGWGTLLDQSEDELSSG
jgi:hypothetical protein